MAVLFKTLSGTLAANVNEITFSDSMINDNTIVEAYYNNNDVYTVETWQNGTTIGIVVNDHNVPVGIRVTLNNVNSFEPYDDSEVLSQLSSLSDDVGALDGRLNSAEDDIDNLENDVDSLETTLSNKQDSLTAGNNITIVDNVISASGGDDVYSNTERVVGTWTDGKPLYEKTFYIPNPTNSGYTQHDISNLGIAFIHALTANRDGAAWIAPGNFFASTTDFLCVLIMRGSPGQIYTRWGSTNTIKELQVTFRYTKTTD